ncbi:MAG: YceI family protein [Caldilineaceae bacterium]
MAWQIDTVHSSIEFSVRHMMISKARGKFGKFSGTIVLDEANPAATTVDVSIDAASIDTGVPDRDGHLRSPDFLDAATYPTLQFKSTKVAVDGDSAKLYGELTIRGVTKPVVLDVEYAGKSKNPWGQTIAGFSAKTKIKRSEWNLVWNAVLETGGVAVSDDVTIEIELEMVQQ